MHTISGTSHVYELNKMHFEGVSLQVVCIADNLKDECVLKIEQEFIDKYKPRLNIRNSSNKPITGSTIEEDIRLIYQTNYKENKENGTKEESDTK